MSSGLISAPAPASGIATRPRPPIPAGPFAVAGLRRAGLAAVDALLRDNPGAEVVAHERFAPSLRRRDRRRLTAAGIGLRFGDEADELSTAPAPRALIKSPGIAFDAPLVRAAEAGGIPVLDELELGWRLSRAPMVAVTGTNGKTTVATLTAGLLAAGGLEVVLSGNTTIGPPLSAVEGSPDWIVCEVSSFQLEGCPALLPEIAVFTNLTRDHLIRHGTMARYGELKRRLFVRGDRAVPVAVIDVVDALGRQLAQEVQARGGKVIRVGLDGNVDYRVCDARWDLQSGMVTLRTPRGRLSLSTCLAGGHNARNVASAVALADLFGIEPGVIGHVLAAHPGPPGRLERLRFGQPCELVIDNAAGPASVTNVLETLRAALAAGRLLVVLGLLGSPEDEHLREVGRAAARCADRLYLTAGSLRPKPPVAAIEGILAGVREVPGARAEVVVQRREAMRTALAAARPEDVVVVLGRGDIAEPVKDRRIDDRVVLRELVTCGSC